MKSARYLPIPITHDLERAPQLVTVATAHAVLAAIQLALERAHPILTSLRSIRTSRVELSDTEHLAQAALLTADELAERLDDYAAALEADGGDEHESELLPF
jgi:hypothetical protein